MTRMPLFDWKAKYKALSAAYVVQGETNDILKAYAMGLLIQLGTDEKLVQDIVETHIDSSLGETKA